MSLKFRFALLFTIVVAFIQIVTSFTIYYFYSNHRHVDFQTKLKSEAILVLDDFENQKENNLNSTTSLHSSFNDKHLFQKKVKIFDENKKVLYRYPDTIRFKVTPVNFQRIKNYEEFTYSEEGRDFYGTYLKEKHKVIIASAIDIEGFSNLQKLKYILIIVFLFSILLTALSSYFFVNSALKPLKILVNQIKETNESTLWNKVDSGNDKDEIAKIAINYNLMIDRLHKAFDLQNIFVQHASHELRTPLTVMFSTTEAALKRTLTGEEYKQVLYSLKEEQNNLIELTNSLLLLYQFDKLKSYENWYDLRIDELIYDAVGYCKKIFPDLSIDFAFNDIPEEQDLIIKGNESLIKAAFVNLIKNAFLYSDDKKLNIFLSASKNELVVHFDNRGQALSQEEVEKLKMPFSRSENIGLVKGIGLGLSIVEKIIKLHHGNLIYKNLPDSVNRFSIQFY